MASNTTQVADLPIIPEIFSREMILRTLATNAFVRSGVAVEDPQLNAFLNSDQGGKTFSPRFLGPLKDDDPNISTDDPAVLAVPKKISGFTNKAVRHSLNQVWSVMDLAVDLNGTDPINAIEMQLSAYWDTVLTRRVLASLYGVSASDQASGGPKDMVVDISGETGAAALFNADAYITARGTMGDRSAVLGNIAVHSTVYQTMQRQNMIDTIPNSQTDIGFGTYMGAGIIVDDAMTVIPATSGESATPVKYYSYLFGRGAIALGTGSPKVPFEVDRNMLSGNGGGEELIASRVEWIIHPQGFSYDGDSTPTVAELQTASKWNRAFERKRIPLAVLITQG